MQAARYAQPVKWICPICGEKHDKDMNAARNILEEGLKQIA